MDEPKQAKWDARQHKKEHCLNKYQKKINSITYHQLKFTVNQHFSETARVPYLLKQMKTHAKMMSTSATEVTPIPAIAPVPSTSSEIGESVKKCVQTSKSTYS